MGNQELRDRTKQFAVRIVFMISAFRLPTYFCSGPATGRFAELRLDGNNFSVKRVM